MFGGFGADAGGHQPQDPMRTGLTDYEGVHKLQMGKASMTPDQPVEISQPLPTAAGDPGIGTVHRRPCTYSPGACFTKVLTAKITMYFNGVLRRKTFSETGPWGPATLLGYQTNGSADQPSWPF